MNNRYLRYCLIKEHSEDPLHLLRCPDVYDYDTSKIVEDLVTNKVLSLDKGYFIMGAGICCNPTLYHSTTFFVNKEDCNKYKELNFKNAQYKIRVCKTVDTV